MKIHNHKLLSFLMFLPAANAMAEANGIGVDLSAIAEFSDNALKDDSNKITEQQDQYNLGVNANYTNDYIFFKSNYDALERTYEKESQPDYTQVEGKTELTLGNQYQSTNLLLTHSRRALLVQPDDLALDKNRDERDILTAQPLFKWKATSSDIVMLKGNFSQIDYKVEDTKRSKQAGAELSWIRGLSQTDQVQLVAQQNKTSFEHNPAADYEYQSLNALYSVKLNRLSYTIQIGQNRALPEAEADAYSSPSYNFESTYSTGINIFNFSASQMITNSSVGGGNQIGDTSSFESSGVGIDLMNLRVMQFSWSSTGLCERCSTNISATSHSQNYKVLAEDGGDKGISAGATYKLSRALAVHLNVSKHKRSFDNSARTDYTSDIAKLSLDYKFYGDLAVKVFLQKEKRDSTDLSRNYDENVTGVSLSYHF